MYKTLLFFLLSFSTSLMHAQYYGFERVDTIVVSVNSSNLELPWAGGLNAAQFSTLDLNNDGIEDLFVFDRTGNKVLTFTNNGSSYEYSPEFEASFPTLQAWAILRDYNCDGKKDIFSYVSGGIGVWKNTSSGGVLSFERVGDSYIESYQYNFTTNLFVSRVDIPDINDIDGDGDLDVLTFGVLGSRLEYHKNLSIEQGFGCDSLVFELSNSCWGHFLETGGNTNVCLLKDTCSSTSNVPNPQKEALKHTGSTILSLDFNNDNVKDILLGDVSFNNIIGLTNDNTGVNMNTSMMSQDPSFPSYDTPIDLELFPSMYFEDVDNDNVKDLIVSPNTPDYTENKESVWFYKNNGTNTLPVFNFVEEDFLQNKMLDYGESAYPVLFDYNNDGLLDLFVSSFGVFDAGTYKSKIDYYLNTGSITEPIFELQTVDFASISTLGLGKDIYPCFGDIDDDNDIDMLIGNYDGNVYLFENTSNSLTSMSFTNGHVIINDDSGNPIDIGSGAKPTLFDLTKNGILDLVVGEERGNLNYFENVGTATNHSFRLQTETFGNVEVSEWWTTIGNSIPTFITNSTNETILFVGAEEGVMYHYNNIDNNLSGVFTGMDTIKTINKGPNGAPAIGNLNNDTYLDLIIGNERGGLTFYYGKEGVAPDFINENNENNTWIVYPNPFKNNFTIKHSFLGKTQYLITDITGKTILKGELTENEISTANLSQGIYLLSLINDTKRYTQKVIKE